MKSLVAFLLITTAALAQDDSVRLNQDLLLPAGVNQIYLPAGELAYRGEGRARIYGQCALFFNPSDSNRTLARGTRLEITAAASLNGVSQFWARSDDNETFALACAARIERVAESLRFEYHIVSSLQTLTIEELAQIPVFVNDDEVEEQSEDNGESERDSGASQE